MTPEDHDIVISMMVESATDDFMGLWELVSTVAWLQPDLDDASLKAMTLQFVRELVEANGLRPGFPDATGAKFNEWTMRIEELLRYIDAEWTRLGRTPTIGDIIWFSRDDD